MAEIVRMPKLSDTMVEGVVAEWHKNVGEAVSSGELLAEIETDKATMEFESFYDGVLLHIGVEKGATAPVNDILAIIGEQGEDVKKILADEEKNTPKEEVKTHRILGFFLMSLGERSGGFEGILISSVPSQRWVNYRMLEYHF